MLLKVRILLYGRRYGLGTFDTTESIIDLRKMVMKRSVIPPNAWTFCPEKASPHVLASSDLYRGRAPPRANLEDLFLV